MQAEIYTDSFGRDSLSVIPEHIQDVFIVNNYLDTKYTHPDAYPVIIDDVTYGVVRAFPAVYNKAKQTYEKDPRWLMYGGRLVHTSNSAGFTLKHPAKLMDRWEG